MWATEPLVPNRNAGESKSLWLSRLLHEPLKTALGCNTLLQTPGAPPELGLLGSRASTRSQTRGVGLEPVRLGPEMGFKGGHKGFPSL